MSRAVGGFYFVLDGHHRVSVAHYHGVEWMDADVTELVSRRHWSWPIRSRNRRCTRSRRQ